LPDGIHIFKPKILIWVNFEGLAMEDAGIFYGHLAHFSRFGTLDREKSGNRVQAIVKCWQCSREKFNPDSKGGVTYKICKKIVQNCTKSATKLYKIVQNLQ
jgi:hypothetical protein